ncbi:VPLPA-CTERM sorting domain-containing protein [Dinoroseobacter sp. S375]|uniref:VPLPA-CTERM sorting domain-containing protein n=1 Tax=Dinoroseobacter sp. S375 TaxID=3415136 RepID=UPI003C7DC719
MLRSVCLASSALALSAVMAQAAPVTAISELSMSHSFIINSGSRPTGIEIETVPDSLTVEGQAESQVDGAGFTTTESSDVQVGNSFSDPPLPFEAQRSQTQVNLGNGDVATAGYDVSILVVNDPDLGNSANAPTRREIEQFGIAAVSNAADPINGSAISDFNNTRDYRFTNTTNDTISFNIAGQFEAEMRAEHQGPEGFARTSGSFEVLFETGPGVDITYFPVAPYLITVDEDDPNASVAEMFFADDGAIAGVTFSGGASAIADGTEVVASLSAQSRYVFGVTLEGGASMVLETAFSQVNAVQVAIPDIPPVPLPASLPLLLAGLGGVAALRRRSR